MEEFDLGDSVSAVVHHPTNPPSSSATPNFGAAANANPPYGGNFTNHQPVGRAQLRPEQSQQRDNSARDPANNITSISSKLNIKAGTSVKILISHVVLPTFFNFIPINQTTNKFREQLSTLLNNIITNPLKQSLKLESSQQLSSVSGQYFVALLRGQVRRVTVKLGHQSLEKNKFVKLQDVDYGGEVVLHCNDVFQVPDENAELLKSIPVLRCNGSMNGLHPNSATRRWSPEQCQSFRQLTESNILDATVARVTLSPQMSVPYYNFDLYFSNGNQLSIADIMRAFEYAS